MRTLLKLGMAETNYLPGTNRRFNDHSVCIECGAMVDNEFVAAHETFHGRDPEDGLTARVRRTAAELREPITWEPLPKVRRQRFWSFR